ncbi:ADP-forming succinate--CoA ligase subunit beta [bacterium]|nr:ADP-forming succinate--CoA ligase subunit beta [bacterium]
MKIHEYQAREIMSKFGIPTNHGELARTPEEVKAIAEKIGRMVVVKAQVHAGGRGKAGGVKLAKTPDEAFTVAQNILGMEIKGLTVDRVLVADAVDIETEYYLGFTLNREDKSVVLIISAAGGVDIEEVAASTPEKITKVNIDPTVGIQDYEIRQAVYMSGVDTSKARAIASFIDKLYDCFMATDAEMAEINPLVITKQGEVVAIDAKMNFDDNALYRQKEIAELREAGSELDEYEVQAKEEGLTYVHLPGGNVGICGNGAGLVMTTMDVVKRAGGTPNNFLDFGGSATAEGVQKALIAVLRDPDVKGIFINVFGGITRTDLVAQGIVDVYDKLERKVPIVIRLTGTREELAKEILEGSNKPLVFVDSMWAGAQKIVELINAEAAGA